MVPDFDRAVREDGGLAEGVGFFSVAYDADTGTRSSASVAYLHPIFSGTELRPNLTVLTNAWVSRLNLSAAGGAAESVTLTLGSGHTLNLHAQHEIILCSGAIDTPRLLLHSGIGPPSQLEKLNIPLQHALPGVGENLLDHAETIMIWELHSPAPPETAMHSDAGLFLDRDRSGTADIMMHTYQIPFCLHTSRLGYPVPKHAFCVTPNVPRPRSRGRLYLTNSDPAVKPALDFRYFTDPGGEDVRTLVDGLRAARRVAAAEPFSGFLKREVAPGVEVQGDEELAEYARRVAHTVYHPVGTTKMGAVEDDWAVVDPQLRIRGVSGVRIADAGVFPSMVTVK